MARLHIRPTLLIVAHRSLMLSKGSISGPPHSNWWWCHDIGYPLSIAEHSPCIAPWSATLCGTISAHSRTMSPLDRAWKPGFSLGTSMFSALETFVTIALYKSTFTIPYHYSAYKWLNCSHCISVITYCIYIPWHPLGGALCWIRSMCTTCNTGATYLADVDKNEKP